MSEDKKNVISEVSKLVPEAYFDVICRIVPGLIFVLALYKLYDADIPLEWQYALITIVFAYFVGFVLDCFSNFVLIYFSILWGWRLLDKYANDEERKKLIELYSVEVVTSNNLRHKHRKSILEGLRTAFRTINLEEKPVLTKVIAEERLLKVAAIGLLVGVITIVLTKNNITGLSQSWLKWMGLGQSASGLPWECIVLLIIIEGILICAMMERMQRPVSRAFMWWRQRERATSNDTDLNQGQSN